MFKHLIGAVLIAGLLSTSAIAHPGVTVITSFVCFTKDATLGLFAAWQVSWETANRAVEFVLDEGLCENAEDLRGYHIKAVVAGPKDDYEGDQMFVVKLSGSGYSVAFPGINSNMPADGILDAISL